MTKKAVYNRKDFLRLRDLPTRLRMWAEDMELEDFISNYAFYQRPLPKNILLTPDCPRVAVIGSGPAGLGCADELNRLGYDVTVFERDDRPGGLLMYGVPNIKLPKDLLEEKLNWLKGKGVKFVVNYELQDEAGFDELQEEFAAIVLCVGSTEPKLLPGVQADNKQIFQAKDFLTLITKDMLDGSTKLDVHGKDVVIIGGGDTGVDCAAVAFAQGARTIRQLEMQECRQTSNSRGDLCNIIQGDFTISYGTRLVDVVRNKNGLMVGVNVAKVNWCSERAGALPRTYDVLGSESYLPAQVLILALGFKGPQEKIFSACGIGKSPLGMIADSGAYFTTTRQGVFAAGDARRGSGVVEWAFAEGRNAAVECAKYLQRRGE